ncbi:GNAT family N-acetyltransferase [Dyella silvatica]|uniref:GNAT family N-acetyltransferase n=1 Tax=Dyella silvatica TaxID=2992128 RepID=UPI0022501733|nr:GNAT family N-acetyltransferase [Dyella silvatica]
MHSTETQHTETQFRDFAATDRPACLLLFDMNCPTYFAPNERDDYAQFLDQHASAYKVCVLDGHIVGAYGLYVVGTDSRALHWILFTPAIHGYGLGSMVMSRVIAAAKEDKASILHISASHKSAPFFAKFGAVAQSTTVDGWGPGMHRVDMQLAR